MQVLSGLATGYLHAHLQFWVLGVAAVEALYVGVVVPQSQRGSAAVPCDEAAVPHTILIRCKFYLLLIFSSTYSPPLGDIKVVSIGIRARISILGLTTLRDDVDK